MNFEFINADRARDKRLKRERKRQQKADRAAAKLELRNRNRIHRRLRFEQWMDNQAQTPVTRHMATMIVCGMILALAGAIAWMALR
jgi:hypothetical protein